MAGVLAAIERHPWRWTLAALLPLLVFPRIDIAVSALFFQPEHHTFVLRTHPVGEFVRKTLPVLLFVIAGLAAGLGGFAAWRKRPVLGVSGRAALFVISALALGPGVIVNVVFKGHWGRPRPSTIAEFFGPNHYVPPFLPSDQCLDNCSFPSGHAALGFWVVAFALLAAPGWRRPALWTALAFGALVGVVRIAQGGHFLSDVLVSGIIVVGLTHWLHGRILVGGEGGPRKNNRFHRAESL